MTPESDVQAEPETDENKSFVLSQGGIVDFLQRLPTPLLVLPGKFLFRVLVHGHGFRIAINDAQPLIGFYTAVFVAAELPLEAKKKAIAKIRDRWETFHPDATGGLFVDVSEYEQIPGHFKLRSFRGFAFYSEDEEGQEHPVS